MTRIVPALALLALAASCSRDSEDHPGASAPTELVVKVDGMQRGEGGKTWMAWPESVKKALEGLSGVTTVEMDLARDLFRVTMAKGQAPSQEAFFGAIRELGHTPSLAVASAFGSPPVPAPPCVGPPALVRMAIARAKADGKKFVLVDCMGDNWVSCKRMSVETFADSEVKRLLDRHFVFVELNVDKEKEAAAWFRGEAIPDTRILDLEGKMLDRVVGFEEPQAFAERLRKTIERR